MLVYSGNERAFEYCNVAEPAPRGHAPTDRGTGIFEPLEAETEGFASVHYGTSGKELVVEDGRVVAGAEDGGGLRIAARKGVVITAGAFTMNDAMLADYVSDTLICGSRTGCENDLGEGILMGQRIGAATRTIGRVNYNRSIYLYGDLAAGALLDYNGRRFVAEDAHGGLVGRSIATHSPDRGFIFIDQPKLDAAVATPYGQYLTPVAQADAKDELAEMVGLPVDNVIDAIERYTGTVPPAMTPSATRALISSSPSTPLLITPSMVPSPRAASTPLTASRSTPRQKWSTSTARSSPACTPPGAPRAASSASIPAAAAPSATASPLAVSPGERRRPGKGRIRLGVNHPRPLAAK